MERKKSKNQKIKLKDKIQKEEKEYDCYHDKYEKLVQKFKNDYPNYYRLKYDVEIVEIKKLQEYLGGENSCKGTALIEYFVGDKYLYVFFLSKDRFEVVRKSRPKKFKKIIQEFQATVSSHYQTETYRYIKSAYQLYKILFPDEIQKLLEDWQAKCSEEGIPDRLIIIPDEELMGIPFDALLTEPVNEGQAFGKLPYLINDYTLGYHFSATLWIYKNENHPTRNVDCQSEFIGFAPVYEGEKKILFRSLEIDGEEYLTLKHSETEVKNIAAMFSKNIDYSINVPSKYCVYLREKATEENLKELATEYRYVLISAHGDYKKKQPERTHIVLSPNKEGEGFSHFNMKDAYNLQMKAELVVLSCCETGLGQVFKGEGVLGLNRGFIYAGAKNVIYTLFKVTDKHSAELTECFFELILKEEGLSYAEALRKAKLSMIGEKGIMPIHWAGFVLIGG